MSNILIKQLPAPKYNVEYIERDNKHIYALDGKELPSVTKILHMIGGEKMDMLIAWSCKQALLHAKTSVLNTTKFTPQVVDKIFNEARNRPEELKKQAGSLGGKVHDAADAYVSGHPYKIISPEVMPGYKNFLTWVQDSGISFICGDTTVASRMYGYGGRVDALGYNKKGNIVLIDFKTSNALRDEYPLQVAAYIRALEEMYGVLATEAVVVRFGKTKPDMEVKTVNISNAWNGFLAALALTKTMNSPLWA